MIEGRQTLHDALRRCVSGTDPRRLFCVGLTADRLYEAEIQTALKETGGGIAVICVNGMLSLTVNECKVEMERGAICTFLSGYPFRLGEVSADFRGFLGIIPPFYLSNVDAHVSITYFLNNGTRPMVKLPEVGLELFEVILRRVEVISRRDDRPYYRETMREVVMIVLYFICGIYEEKPRQEHRENLRDEELMREFLVLVEQNCRQERSLAFYAGLLSVTPKHLSASIKRTSGLRGTQWINHLLVLNIKRTLRTSPMSVQQVSDYYSFSNPSFFVKYFKKHTGMTPRRYKTL